MTTKKCTICKQEKVLSNFNKHPSKKDGLQSACKECNKERSALYYKKNAEHHRQVVNAQKIVLRTRNAQHAWDYLLEHPCVDCGETDPIVLEFDHVSDKIDSVSRMIYDSYSLESLEKEIAKCEVRCANCHRRKTAKQLGWYKNINTGSVT